MQPPTATVPAMGVFPDFTAASQAVLAWLRRRFGFGLWMVTRVDCDDWIVLTAEDHHYGVKPGTVFRWADSFCSRMARGEGPRVAPRARDIATYREAPIGQQVDIAAYVGLPLYRADGGLFGTLCAIDPEPQPPALEQELPLLELMATLLSTVLSVELERDAQRRLAEGALVAAEKDALTGLCNRRGWDARVEQEEARCTRYGHPAAVVAVDLDNLKVVNDSAGHAAGDALLARAAAALGRCTRTGDVLARLGGDEFALLLTDCSAEALPALERRVRDVLHDAGVPASVGAAARHPARGLRVAASEADRAMYLDKRTRKAQPR